MPDCSIHFSYFCGNDRKVRKNEYILLILLFSVMTSCRVSRPMIAPASGNGLPEIYINQYRDIAISEMKRTGVPASITLAQGMVESDYGRSTLARLGNNHFGIKCHNGWKGQTMRKHDDRRNECSENTTALWNPIMITLISSDPDRATLFCSISIRLIIRPGHADSKKQVMPPIPIMPIC